MRAVADQGDPDAQLALGGYYQKDVGVPKDLLGDGHVVTNDHVARNCKGFRIRRLDESVGTATLVAPAMDEDLALLKADSRPEAVAAFRPGRDPGQGETIVAFGFPLSAVLASSGNVASGKVTALVGIDSDERFPQMSTQVKPGNSGGPLLDMNSRVVGIITTPAETRKAGKAAEQNARTAVKGNAAAAFLQKLGVAVSIAGGSPRTLNPAEVGDRAKRFTVRIECLT